MTRLFYKIFAIFCLVIICAISVASFSFWIVQTTVNEVKIKQQRNIESTFLFNTANAFRTKGERGIFETFEEWRHTAERENLFVIREDDNKDIFDRPIDADEIASARTHAHLINTDPLVQVAYDRFGQEYLFFIKGWDNPQVVKPRLPRIPGLPLAPIWHELIILSLIIIAGLVCAYILASYIAKPIRILQTGFHKLADGDLDTRISKHMGKRKDELAGLADDFDEMAEQLQLLVEKERHLLHHVSHEMRSPLARIQAMLSLIQQQPQKQEQYIARLENELKRMDLLVGELLTLARLESGNAKIEYDLLNFNTFIDHLIQDSGSVAYQNKQTLQLTPSSEQCFILANEDYLYRAFDNVIRNAMNYSPEGSLINIRFIHQKNTLIVDVDDNGPGVKEEEIPSLFIAFFRASSGDNKPGTGLGLALSRHIIEQHNGKISAYNIKPHGLRMRFELPLASKPALKKAEKEKQKNNPEKSA